MMPLTKSCTSVKLGHVGAKSRSVCQIIEKPCEHSKGHIFSLMKFKLAQNGVLDKTFVFDLSKSFNIKKNGIKF